MRYLTIITKLNMDSRPRIIDTETGVVYPISIFDDLKEHCNLWLWHQVPLDRTSPTGTTMHS